MIVGDLFSGIGGFSLAAEWMGWRTAWFSEIDPFASRILSHHWPDVPNLGDITAIDFTTVEPVDVLTAGFPCQPHSLAGKRQGSNDKRDLFDEIIRAAGVLRPQYIVLENVPGLFTSDAGRFFGRVLGAVASLGYDAEWRVLSAADVGAPHRRERVWIVAHANITGLEGSGEERSYTERCVASGHAGPSRVGARGQWEVEPNVGRVVNGLPSRMDRLRCLGNAIVPQCAVEIFRSIDRQHTDTVKSERFICADCRGKFGINDQPEERKDGSYTNAVICPHCYSEGLHDDTLAITAAEGRA